MPDEYDSVSGDLSIKSKILLYCLQYWASKSISEA